MDFSNIDFPFPGLRILIWYLYSEAQTVSGCHLFKVPEYVFSLKTYFPELSMLFAKHLKLFWMYLKMSLTSTIVF